MFVHVECVHMHKDYGTQDSLWGQGYKAFAARSEYEFDPIVNSNVEFFLRRIEYGIVEMGMVDAKMIRRELSSNLSMPLKATFIRSFFVNLYAAASEVKHQALVRMVREQAAMFKGEANDWIVCELSAAATMIIMSWIRSTYQSLGDEEMIADLQDVRDWFHNRPDACDRKLPDVEEHPQTKDDGEKPTIGQAPTWSRGIELVMCADKVDPERVNEFAWREGQ